MAAVIRQSGISVRGARPGEGRAIASLWRELWDAHENWGGYRASHDARVYEELAARLDEDARVRASHPVLGRHVHLVASNGAGVSGQVEGWFERHGVETTTPFTCEVRSLIVTSKERKSGAGRALLDGLAATALGLARGAQVVLAAEVLQPNPAYTFYEKVGYTPISWSTRIDARPAAPGYQDLHPPENPSGVAKSSATATPPRRSFPLEEFSARLAHPRDALAVAVLESSLASRRRSLGDLRYDRPRAVDAVFVGAIAAHLGTVGQNPQDPVEVVASDRHGNVRASASFAVGTLEPPFIPSRRAVMGRFALDPALDARLLIPPLINFGKKLANERSVPYIELTDLSPPGTPAYQATLDAKATPWSRIYCKLATP
jgi:GNAT superfamily N-acetyltransferase